MGKIRNLVKEYKSEFICFVILLILALILGTGWVILTLLIEIGFLVKWELGKRKSKERKKFNNREKGLFIGLIIVLFVMICVTEENINTDVEYENTISQMEKDYKQLEYNKNITIDTLEDENSKLRENLLKHNLGLI